MCELFAMSSLRPATVSISLKTFAPRGGRTGPHKDGWGIAFYQERDALLIRESTPASDSDLERFIERHNRRSTRVISHLRKATQGEVALRNTQPFARELAGRQHIFAHNGDLLGMEGRFRLGMYHPVGETDSEHAFCALLHQIQRLWRFDQPPPSVTDRLKVVADFAAGLREMGPANFIYCDSDVMFVHADHRKDAQGNEGAPGLYLRCWRCAVDRPIDTEGLHIEAIEAPQQSTLVASVPLTDEACWTAMPRGTTVALVDGEVVASCSGEGRLGTGPMDPPS